MADTSAASERKLSAQGIVHSKLRNRLGNEKVSKLVFIRENMNMNTVSLFINKNYNTNILYKN